MTLYLFCFTNNNWSNQVLQLSENWKCLENNKMNWKVLFTDFWLSCFHFICNKDDQYFETSDKIQNILSVCIWHGHGWAVELGAYCISSHWKANYWYILKITVIKLRTNVGIFIKSNNWYRYQEQKPKCQSLQFNDCHVINAMIVLCFVICHILQ